jgi:5-methylcytosine-specific restriction endonuclease McrA
MVSSAVLVLNQNYEPLNVCNARRAFVLVDRGKAEVLEHNSGYLRSPSYSFLLPSVIRLVYLIRRPRPQMRLTRKEIFSRDHYTCQYCGKRTHDLTLDHVVPRNKGGQRRPPATAFYLFYDYLEREVEWRKFIPGWEVPNGYA